MDSIFSNKAFPESYLIVQEVARAICRRFAGLKTRYPTYSPTVAPLLQRHLLFIPGCSFLGGTGNRACVERGSVYPIVPFAYQLENLGIFPVETLKSKLGYIPVRRSIVLGGGGRYKVGIVQPSPLPRLNSFVFSSCAAGLQTTYLPSRGRPRICDPPGEEDFKPLLFQ